MVGRIVTLGFGSVGTVPTFGFSIGAAVELPPLPIVLDADDFRFTQSDAQEFTFTRADADNFVIGGP